jgi:hypothetical protein
MDKGRVGEENKGKEMDGCPLTVGRLPLLRVQLRRLGPALSWTNIVGLGLPLQK